MCLQDTPANAESRTNMANGIDFDMAFCALTDHGPFPWQRNLYEWLTAKGVPSKCDIPTGLGKTAVVAVWLIALAKCPKKIPRRLVYVVNRRTVVDQTTNEAMKLRDKLRDNAAGIGIDNLAISTLRGQFADNGEWSADPSRPAIIVGTVDMIGSRLLFGGYRIGFKRRPLHAGFLGQDALLVHDEAHLEPAFQKLIEEIQQEQNERERTGELPWPKLHVMALSATTRGGNENAQTEEEAPFGLTDQEKQPPDEIPDPPTKPVHHVWRRLKAKKSMRLHKAAGNKVAEQVAELALEHKRDDAAVLVYVRTIDDVLKVCTQLTKKKDGVSPDCVQQLTGTMRGYERDQLVKSHSVFALERHRNETRLEERDQLVKSHSVFARFMPPSDRAEGVTPAEGTVYLVCTSAGEVGANLSADHMVCDLSTLESMIQRFGRVNRFGDGDARIDVVYPEKFGEKDKLTPARRATLKLLQDLDGDASPRALVKMAASLTDEQRKGVFAPEPTMLPTTDVIFDAWSLTTIREKMPGRPPVAPYLHGVTEWEPPETYVAWRTEVGIITADVYKPEDLLDDYPLKPHELLRDTSKRVFAELKKCVAEPKPTAKLTAEERQNARERAKKNTAATVWLIDSDDTVRISTLQQLLDQGQSAIENRTLLLPPKVGGLARGMFDGTSAHADDVANISAPETERRLRLWCDDEEYDVKTAGMWLVRSIDRFHDDDDDDERPTWDWYKCKPLEDTRTAQRPVEWHIHVRDAVDKIDRILAGLSLPKEIAQAVRVAAQLHDHGKRRPQFQRMLGNRKYPERVLAKSGRTGAKLPEIYRHEFGSLADAMEDAEFQRLSPEMRDLVLHLIAASHGRARPHFPMHEAFDPAPGRTQADAERLAAEVPRRFARLQRKYGRWGLAYLESLLRAADWAASAEPSEFVIETKEVSQ